MKKLLEITYDGGPILDVVFAAQRVLLEKELGRGFMHLSLSGIGRAGRAKILQKASKQRWDAVLIRGIRGMKEASPFFTRTPFFVDHVGGYDFGVRNEFSQFASKLRRVFCYSPQADSELRSAGIGGVSTLAGPFLPSLPTPRPMVEVPVMGLLDTGHGARAVLGGIKRVRDAQGWGFEIVTTVRDADSRQVDNAFEVAEQCDLLVCPMEFKDQGTPHEGAILALSIGRALATSHTSAILTMPYPSATYLPVERYGLGSFNSVWEVYRRGRTRLDGWPTKARTDHNHLPREILKRL
jgi:hypothetical protein